MFHRRGLAVKVVGAAVEPLRVPINEAVLHGSAVERKTLFLFGSVTVTLLRW